MNVCEYSGIAICVANVIEEVYQLSKDGKIMKHVVNIGIVLACTFCGAIFGPVGTLIGALVGTAIRLIMNKLNKWSRLTFKRHYYIKYHPIMKNLYFSWVKYTMVPILIDQSSF